MRNDLARPSDPQIVRRTTVLLAVVCCLVVGAVAGASFGVSGTPTGVDGPSTGGFDGMTGGALPQIDIDPDDVLITVDVGSDGDAIWTIEYRMRLTDDADRQAFEDLRADVEADPASYTGRFRERMNATVDGAAVATEREMSVSGVAVTAERNELPQEYGVITYEFRWNGFAAVEGDRLVAGDAIDAMFLDEATSLIVSWPRDHRLVDATPSPTETRDRSVVWVGPTDFTDGQPRVTVDSSRTGIGLPIGTGSIAVGIVLFLVTAVGVLVAYSRREGTPSGIGPIGGVGVDPDGSDDDGDGDAGDGTASETGDTGVDADDGSDTDDGSDDPDDTEGRDDSGSDDGAPVIDEELLSNEEQVLRLIEANGGRMKQQRVAEELDWTDAKTSQVTTGLRDEGELEGFRLGRENVLSLPDDEEE